MISARIKKIGSHLLTLKGKCYYGSFPFFRAGEEAVTLDLLPLIMAIANEGRIEEEMYLTTFLFEEAKHMEFFRYTLDQIGETGDLTVYHSDTYKSIFL
ncbi:hypothetical protein RCO48_31735 [Peribacillus frigoritolerans]|nr:hypothetical protein [Peribacillus frigoritolerans]